MRAITPAASPWACLSPGSAVYTSDTGMSGRLALCFRAVFPEFT